VSLCVSPHTVIENCLGFQVCQHMCNRPLQLLNLQNHMVLWGVEFVNFFVVSWGYLFDMMFGVLALQFEMRFWWDLFHGLRVSYLSVFCQRSGTCKVFSCVLSQSWSRWDLGFLYTSSFACGGFGLLETYKLLQVEICTFKKSLTLRDPGWVIILHFFPATVGSL